MSWFDGVTAQSTASVGADGPARERCRSRLQRRVVDRRLSGERPRPDISELVADDRGQLQQRSDPRDCRDVLSKGLARPAPPVRGTRRCERESLPSVCEHRSRSDYCKVVQADDFIFPQCLEQMIALANRHSHVGLVLGYRRFEGTVDLVSLPLSRETAPGAELLRRSLLEGPQLLGPPTAQLFRSDLVRRRTPFYDATFSTQTWMLLAGFSAMRTLGSFIRFSRTVVRAKAVCRLRRGTTTGRQKRSAYSCGTDMPISKRTSSTAGFASSLTTARFPPQ